MLVEQGRDCGVGGLERARTRGRGLIGAIGAIGAIGLISDVP